MVHAFSIEFVYDEQDYRTAVKVTRLSAAPIRLSPVVGYCFVDDGCERGDGPLFAQRRGSSGVFCILRIVCACVRCFRPCLPLTMGMLSK
jgi:hypothetical protein